jgi:hypothetical protein
VPSSGSEPRDDEIDPVSGKTWGDLRAAGHEYADLQRGYALMRYRPPADWVERVKHLFGSALLPPLPPAKALSLMSVNEYRRFYSALVAVAKPERWVQRQFVSTGEQMAGFDVGEIQEHCMGCGRGWVRDLEGRGEDTHAPDCPWVYLSNLFQSLPGL